MRIMTWVSMTDYYYLQATLDSGPQINLVCDIYIYPFQKYEA